MRDLEFLSGQFFDYEIPKEKRYLLKYFKTDLQLAFLRYYLVFDNAAHFVEHTGYYCTDRLLWKLKARCRRLMRIYEEAKVALTEEGMAIVEQIESGKFKL